MQSLFDGYYRDVGSKKITARWEAQTLALFAKHPIANMTVASVTPEIVSQLRDAFNVGPASTLRYLCLLSAVFEYARRELRLVAVNPVKDVRKPKQPRPRTRLPTDDEIERICIALGYDEDEPVETCKQQIAVAFMLSAETAMRSGEILSLEWRHVDLARKVAHLPRTKNGDPRDVPLTNRAVELISRLRGLDAARVFTTSENNRDTTFRRAMQAAGVTGLHFHDARALALTRLARKVDVLRLARIAGHRDIKSLMIYYRESAEDIARELD
jgi:integrase